MDPAKALNALLGHGPKYKRAGTVEWMPLDQGVQLRQGDLVTTVGVSDPTAVDIGGRYPSKLEVRPESTLIIEEDVRSTPRLQRAPFQIVSGAADFSGRRR